jgi:MFS family permease
MLADYLGRVKVLMITMLWYGILTALCGFAQTYEQLLVLRFICGIGLGGEWGVGAALVTEYWPENLRSRATSFVHSGWPVGYGLASVAYMFIVPLYGWRALFFIGIIPAIVAIWVRYSVPEPEVYLEAKKKIAVAELSGNAEATKAPLALLFSAKHRYRTFVASLLTTGALMAYWGSASWLPSFLATTRGLDVVRTGSFLIILNIGAFFGYQFFGWVADTYGRRASFKLGITGSIIVTLIYVSINDNSVLMWFGPIFAFVTYGFFGPFGSFLAELFPPEIRATAASLCFNVGRGMSMLSPFMIGAFATNYGLAYGLGLTAVFNLLGLIAVFLLPETRTLGVAIAAKITSSKKA